MKLYKSAMSYVMFPLVGFKSFSFLSYSPHIPAWIHTHMLKNAPQTTRFFYHLKLYTSIYNIIVKCERTIHGLPYWIKIHKCSGWSVWVGLHKNNRMLIWLQKIGEHYSAPIDSMKDYPKNNQFFFCCNLIPFE